MTNYKMLILLVTIPILVLQTCTCSGVVADCVEPSPLIILTPSSGISVITVIGNGFPKNQGIHIFWNGTAVPGWIGDLKTSHDETFCAIMTIQTQTPGTYNITITVDGKSASASFTVLDITGPQGPKGDTGAQGAKGDAGPQGPQGEKGDTGEAGTAGTVWYWGHGVPDNSIGVSGDFYLDVDTGNVYYKNAEWTDIGCITGPQGPQGLQGPQGIQGPVGPQGEQGPAGPQGEQSPQGPKGDTGAQGAKGDAGQQGEAGQNGTVWYSGSVSPDVRIGSSNDYYLNVANGDVYQKQNGIWTKVGNIQGPEGPQGLQGLQGVQGPKGDKGDTGDVGATGPQGPKGEYTIIDILPMIIAIVISSAAFLLSAFTFQRKKRGKLDLEIEMLLEKARKYT